MTEIDKIREMANLLWKVNGLGDDPLDFEGLVEVMERAFKAGEESARNVVTTQETKNMDETITKNWNKEEVEKALRKAFNIPSHAEVEFEDAFEYVHPHEVRVFGGMSAKWELLKGKKR